MTKKISNPPARRWLTRCWPLASWAVLVAFGLLLPVLVCAQAPTAADSPEMADAFRQDGKFWVVVACFGLVMAGMFAYLLRLESKVGQLEKRLDA